MTQALSKTLRHLALLAPAAVLGVVAAPALAGTAAPSVHEEQASISFVNRGGIRDWQSAGDDTLYIQDRRRQWYKATLMAPSFELPFAWAIGFDADPMDRLDHFSSVIVEGRRYPLQSLVRVEGPPSRKHGRDDA